jgi:hypothetical protein
MVALKIFRINSPQKSFNLELVSKELNQFGIEIVGE